MSREFRLIFVRALCLLTVFGLLSATPGCGDDPKKSDEAGGIPENVKQSNKNMEDFMKSKQQQRKKR